MNQHRHADVPAVEARALSKTYPGGVAAVVGLDLRVEAGEVFGLLGPNGAGKSTTIGMLTTAVRPTAGSMRVAGIDVVAEPLAARAVSAVVFQDAVVDRTLTGRRNCEIHARLWGVSRRHASARIDEAATAFGLEGIMDRAVATYSGGQRRRLEIARALLSEPRVLFLDEPTVGLDPLIRHELIDLLARLRAESGTTILLTTHYLDEAERLCDRVAIMHGGRVVALDTPDALLAALGREVLDLRVHGDAAAALTALAALQSHRVAGRDAFTVGATLTVPLHDLTGGEAIAAVGALGLPIAELTTRRPSLDDVYLKLTGDRLAA
jgi:ABC-2 type transport system ATP-binding protein